MHYGTLQSTATQTAYVVCSRAVISALYSDSFFDFYKMIPCIRGKRFDGASSGIENDSQYFWTVKK
jgi:hypothetical protein